MINTHTVRRRSVAATLIAGSLLAAGAGSASPAQAAETRCENVGYVYQAQGKFYSIAGMRCNRTMNKIVVSGWMYAGLNDKAWEISKSCKSKRYCLARSPLFDNPAGQQRYRLVFASGRKVHWYSIPKYRGFNKYFTL
jgi:hypothetical protein